MKIAITTSSFARFSDEPLRLLREAGIEYVLNDKGRALTEDEAIKILEGCDGVAAGTEPLTKKVMDAVPGLRVISRCGTGVDNVDLAAAAARNILVRNTPDGPTLAVTELTIGMMLSLLRQISLMDREVHSGTWKKRMGTLLYQKRIGIVGMGRIGRAMTGRLLPFETEVAYTDPMVEGAAVGVPRLELEELLDWADIVTLHCPKPENGQPVLDARKLALMRRGSFLINVARGGLVDEDALFGLLTSGHIAGAALDVYGKEPYEGPLKGMNNVILTPHVGSHARETRVIMETDTIKNLLEALVDCNE